MGKSDIPHCIYKAKVAVFTSAGMIPCTDRQENKRPADDREPGCRGWGGCTGLLSAVQSVWRLQKREGGASIVCCVISTACFV